MTVVYTVAQAAEKVQVSERTLRREIRAKHLRAKKIGACVRVLEEDLTAWLRSDA